MDRRVNVQMGTTVTVGPTQRQTVRTQIGQIRDGNEEMLREMQEIKKEIGELPEEIHLGQAIQRQTDLNQLGNEELAEAENEEKLQSAESAQIQEEICRHEQIDAERENIVARSQGRLDGCKSACRLAKSYLTNSQAERQQFCGQLQKKLKEKVSKAAAVSSQKDRLAKRKSEGHQAIDQHQNEMKTVEAERDGFQAELQRVEAKKTQIKADLSRKVAELNDLPVRISAPGDNLAEWLLTTVASYQRGVEQTKIQLTDVTKATRQGKIDAKAKCSQVAQKRTEIEGQKTEMEKAISLKKSEEENFQADVAQADCKISAKRQELADLKSLQVELQQQSDAEEVEAAKKQDEFNSQEKRLNEELVDIQNRSEKRRDESQATEAKFYAEIGDVEAKMFAIVGDLEQISQETTAVRVDIETHKELSDDWQRQIVDFQSETARFNAEVDAESGELQTEVTMANGLDDQSLQETNTRVAECDQLERERDELLAQKEVVNAEVVKFQSELTEMRKEADMAKLQTNLILAELNDLKEEEKAERNCD